LLIEDKSEIVLSAYFFGIPPQLAPIQCENLDTRHLVGPYTLWFYPVCMCEGLESSFCCPRFFHALVMMLLERQVRTHPDTKPACRLSVEWSETLFDPYHCCHCCAEVFFVGSSNCEQCCLRFGGVEL